MITGSSIRSLDSDPLPPLNVTHEAGVRAQFVRHLRDIRDRSERSRLRLRIPRNENLFERHRGMHFHFKPEVFLQIDGLTQFRFPHEALDLHPGEVAVLPRGLPHHETVFGAQKPFRNLVVGFYSNTVGIHFAHEARPQEPDIEIIQFFPTPDLARLLGLLDNLVQASDRPTPSRSWIIKGLTTALFACLSDLAEAAGDEVSQESGKVFQAKWLVREQISNPELNVKRLATKLHCSADYLSHMFAAQTGETLIHYIQRQRINGARFALRTTPLSIAEIAWASGFADASYFTRVFKKLVGTTPQGYRKAEEARLRSPEADPKTVYYDRVDFSPGRASTGSLSSAAKHASPESAPIDPPAENVG